VKQWYGLSRRPVEAGHSMSQSQMEHPESPLTTSIWEDRTKRQVLEDCEVLASVRMFWTEVIDLRTNCSIEDLLPSFVVVQLSVA
jgi:hypothetical protein